MYTCTVCTVWANLHICTIFFLQTNNFTSSFSDGRILCYLVHHYHPRLLPLDRIQNETTVTQSAQELRRKENEELGNEGWEEQSGNWTTSFSPGRCSCVCVLRFCTYSCTVAHLRTYSPTSFDHVLRLKSLHNLKPTEPTGLKICIYQTNKETCRNNKPQSVKFTERATIVAVLLGFLAALC